MDMVLRILDFLDFIGALIAVVIYFSLTSSLALMATAIELIMFNSFKTFEIWCIPLDKLYNYGNKI